nr:hypothetical protein GCM10020185_23730 [Pseudomonas brassicacearum subsp. brassicacearum]
MSDMHLSDVTTLRERARQNVQNGAVTEGYGADRQEVVRLLNEALATELVCVLRYKRHYFMATGLKASVAASEFLEHANQEAEHADKLAERIVQLGGEPEFNPDLLTRNSHAQYVAGNTLKEMVYEDLVAERIAIDSYREIIQYIGEKKTQPPGASSKTSWPRKKSMPMTWPISWLISSTAIASRLAPTGDRTLPEETRSNVGASLLAMGPAVSLQGSATGSA